MLKWIENLDSVVQAAIIGACATVLGVIIKGIFDVVTNKKKKYNTTIPNVNTKQNSSGNDNINFGEQNQDGSGNVQNTYINCNIQSTQANDNDFDERIEKFMQEHTVTKEDIDKLFDDDTIPEDDTTEEKRITTIDNAVVVRMKNFAGGNTVLIGDEKTITEQIIKEHDEEVERALSEL